MKRPSFQFYPADWRNNAKLRRCSEAARGAWMDVLCVLHDMDEYGICRWPLADLARSANINLKLVKELVDKDVLKGKDKDAEPYIFTPRHAGKDGEPVVLVENNGQPLWYCSRFVRDEYIRQRRGGETRFTAENNPKKQDESAKTERALLRERVFSKTNGACYHCTNPLGKNWEIDHLHPKSKGGTDDFTNLMPSCVSCNQLKSDTLPNDYQKPKQSPTRTIGDELGDGSTSSSTSTYKTNEETHSEETNTSVEGTLAGSVCKSLKDLNFLDINPSHPLLLAMLEAGATLDEFTNAGKTAKVKKFAYVLSMVEGMRKQAAEQKVTKGNFTNEKPWYISVAGVDAKGKELKIEQQKDENWAYYRLRVLKAAGITEEMVRTATQDFGSKKAA